MSSIDIVDYDDSRSGNSGTPGPTNPITREKIVELCLKHGFYKTPSCNDKLYLHHKGFDQICGLEDYTECKVLWLEGNCIQRIEGLNGMKDMLRSLYLHENMLTSLDGISIFTALDGLNVSDNQIASLEGFRPAPGCSLPSPIDTLGTLQAKNNKLRQPEDIEILAEFKKLSVVDISGNELKDGEGVLKVLEQMPNLKSLRLNGNPFVRSMNNYRKVVISRCKLLMHLDDRPVFADERRLVTAWAEGGMEAEKREREVMKKEEEEKVEKRLEEFRAMCKAAREGGSKSESESEESSEGEDGAASKANADRKTSAPPSAPVPATQKAPVASSVVEVSEEEEGACWTPS